MTKEISTGRISYSDPRGVKIAAKYVYGADPNSDPHSAVHGDLNVFTDSAKQAATIIAKWPDIMAAAQQKVVDIIASLGEVEEDGEEEKATTGT